MLRYQQIGSTLRITVGLNGKRIERTVISEGLHGYKAVLIVTKDGYKPVKDDSPDLFKLIKQAGGLRPGRLSGEYRALPPQLKRKDGMTLGEMAMHLFEVEPGLFKDGYTRRAAHEWVDEGDLLEAITAYQDRRKREAESPQEDEGEAVRVFDNNTPF